MRPWSCVLVIGFLAAMTFAVSGCSSTKGGQAMQTSPTAAQGAAKFVHCVFFNIKPGTPDSAIDSQIADAQKLLARIPSVRRVESGRRDTRLTRDVNDKDFTIGLVVYFDDKAGLDIYNDHPIHLEYIAKHKAVWGGVRVCDFQAQ